MKKEELIKREEQFEREGKFNEHITEPAFKSVFKVGEDYQYVKKGFFSKVVSAFSVGIFKLAGLFVAPYCRLKIVGGENLNKVDRAIITSNHINDIDCVLIKKAVKNKPLKIVVADFNNPKGIFGNLLRSAGTMPLSDNFKAMINFSNGITHYLNKNNFILFYPERAEWWCYKKPRPILRGASYYAVKNDVPVIPMFFTFTDFKGKGKRALRQKFTLHVGEPIYPSKDKNSKEREAELSAKIFEFNKKVYEEFYEKPLTYLK